MIGVPSYILDLCPPILQSDFEGVDVPGFKVKPLYTFIEKFPFLTFFIELKIALLLDEPLAGFGIRSDDEGFYMIVPTASYTERDEE